MAELVLTANGTNLTIQNKISIVGTQVNYDTCRFEFDDAWNGYTKTAVFYRKPTEKTPVILDETNSCPFPWESVQDGGILYIGVFGVLDDVILPTNFVMHRVVSGSYDGIAPPTEDVYAQIIAIMQQQSEDAQAAQTANTEAEGHATEAERQAGIAAGHAAAAEQQAGIAEGHAGDALTQANRAEGQADRAKDEADRAEGEADRAGNNILNGVDTHNTEENSHPYLLSEQMRIEAIARGKANSKVFTTYADMMAWLADPEHVAELNIGDNLYIEALDVPDYWWNGEEPKQLEAEAPRLVDYYTKTEVDNRLPISIEQADYDALVAAGTVIAGRIYYVVPDGTLGGE